MTSEDAYSLQDSIEDFFTLTLTTRETCDSKAVELVGGKVVPVAVQGNCSYTVFAGPELEFVVQFRPKPLGLRLEIIHLAGEIHNPLVPAVSFHGQLGEDSKSPLLVYSSPRIRGKSYLDLVLANSFSDSPARNCCRRTTFIKDVAR